MGDVDQQPLASEIIRLIHAVRSEQMEEYWLIVQQQDLTLGWPLPLIV